MLNAQVEQRKEDWREDWRTRCYDCYRPIDRCFCDKIPTINNRTNVLIFQHMRERFHAFNTARILRKSLLNSRIVVDHMEGLAQAFALMPFSVETGLLYPGDGAELLEELSPIEMPKQLVVLDGTWHHTKTLFRDIPQLRGLRKVRLAPAQPSRYGIRREPHVSFLSTLEATVAALRCLEPETQGLDQLEAAFDSMVESQLAHPRSVDSVRRKHRPRAPLNIPKVLRNNLQNVVVVYGETAPGTGAAAQAGHENGRGPVYWVAERLGTSERFERAILPSSVLPESFLGHLALAESAFSEAVSIDTFRREWGSFLQPTDTLAYYFSNCTRLLDVIGGSSHLKIYLKSIQLHRGKKNGTLEELLAALQVVPGGAHGQGRAGKRLASSIALTRYLNSCALD